MVSGVTRVVTWFQDSSAETVAFGRQSAPLVIGQPEAPATELRLEDAILFPQVLDDIELVAAHPAGERDEKEAKREAINHGPSLLD